MHRIDLPPLNGAILILGDGDFSYSLALAKKNKSRGNAHITATSFDSQKVVKKTYGSARENIKRLRNHDKVTVIHNVDATNLSPPISKECYESIVWNFPYPADQKGGVSSTICSEMILHFFRQAKEVLTPAGKIYLTLSQRQGGTTREVAAPRLAWDIEEQCYQADLDLIEVLPFDPEEFEGYEPKRAYADVTFPYGKAGKTHVIQHRKETKPGDSPSDRTVFSRFASFIIERSGLFGRNFAFMRPETTLQLLEPDIERSNVARDLFAAAECFQRVVTSLSTLKNLEGAVLGDTELIELGRRITVEMSQVFETREGFLVVLFTSQPQMKLARGLVRYFLASLLRPHISEFDWARVSDLWFNHPVFVYWIRRVFDSSCEAKMNGPEYELFQRALFVLCYLERFAGSESSAGAFSNAACRMLPENEYILYHRALLNCESLATRWVTFKYMQNSVIQDLEKVQALLRHDETHPLYQNAVYMMAFAYRSSYFFATKDWERAIDLFDHFISIVDPIDRMLPAAHYHAGLLCMTGRGSRKDRQRARDYYVRGLQSEGERLKFFGPVEAQSKVLLSILTMTKEDQIPVRKTSNVNPKPQPNEKEANDHSLDPRIMLTFEEIQCLLDETGPMKSSNFITACRKKYGKDPSNGMKLRDIFQELSNAGLISLKKGSGKILRLIPKKRRRSKSFDEKKEESAQTLNAKDIQGLLLHSGGEMYVSQLKRELQTLNQRPFPCEIKVKPILEKLSKESGLFVFDQRGTTSWWITLPGDYKASARNFEIAHRIHKLLESEGSKPVSIVVQRYTDLYKEPPFPKGKSQECLMDLAEMHNLFLLSPISKENKNMEVKIKKR